MLIRKPSDLPSSAITPRATYLNRRKFLYGLGLAGIGLAAGSLSPKALAAPDTRRAGSLAATRNPDYSVGDALTPREDVTGYNNYYEFGTDKDDPARYAGSLQPRPWSVVIDGEVHKPVTVDLDQLLKPAVLEERIYRLRCVEAWSMVIPWIGFPLAALLQRVEPTGQARYVGFTTLADPRQMPGLASPVLDWPYREGLRLDEAMHPLSLLAVGLYGEVLPNQNGAPLRLVAPWKYGFKSIKSIVRITLTREQPVTSWNQSAPQEYGFYANVNPGVDHPRWSQAKERRLGEDSIFTPKRKTLMLNGYAEQVGQLYAGMDLRRFF